MSVDNTYSFIVLNSNRLILSSIAQYVFIITSQRNKCAHYDSIMEINNIIWWEPIITIIHVYTIINFIDKNIFLFISMIIIYTCLWTLGCIKNKYNYHGFILLFQIRNNNLDHRLQTSIIWKHWCIINYNILMVIRRTLFLRNIVIVYIKMYFFWKYY